MSQIAVFPLPYRSLAKLFAYSLKLGAFAVGILATVLMLDARAEWGVAGVFLCFVLSIVRMPLERLAERHPFSSAVPTKDR